MNSHFWFLLSSRLLNAQNTADALEGSASNACSSESGDTSEYSFPLHIGGIFIVLAISGLGVFTSLLMGVYHNNNGKSIFLLKALQLTKMFGIGVIAATAWIHLLPDAFSQFANPCLDPWWQSYGTNWVGVFGLLAAFAVQLIELAGHSHVKKSNHHHHDHDEHNHNHHDDEEHELPIIISHCPIQENACEFQCDAHVTMGLEQSLGVIYSPIATSETSVFSKSFANTALSSSPTGPIPISSLESSSIHPDIDGIGVDDIDTSLDSTRKSTLKTSKSSHAIKRISAMVLEAGILAHSLIIGIALGVTPDISFTTLLIAICFHQLFEGMALGVLVANTNLSLSSKLILGVMYPITTPIGISIGIIIRNSYNPNASSLLLTQGIFSSLSAGILIYNTYCELVGGEINHNPTFDRFESSFKIVCFLAMYLGATATALLGYWA